MNLQENIHRVKQMMGIINEDNNTSRIMKMIDSIGVHNTIKFFGGYNEFKKHSGDIDITKSREGKIEVMKEILGDESMMYGDHGWDGDTFDVIVDNDKIRRVIFGYYPHGVFMETYDKDRNGNLIGRGEGETIYYDKLPDDLLEKVFENVINFAPIRLPKK